MKNRANNNSVDINLGIPIITLNNFVSSKIFIDYK